MTVNTLDNAIFIKMRNDVSFIIDCNMCLYEHQSTYCPNMPLRGFFYFADLYKKLTKGIDLSVRKQVKIPTPHYLVFYNGMERQEEEYVQHLSDAFAEGKNGCMELTVRTLNINFGHNQQLLEQCRTLYGYAYFVAAVRRNMQTMEMREAVESAIDQCIQADILREFLSEQKAEVVAMSIYEYNEEYVRKTFFEEGRETGYDEGLADGAEKKLIIQICRKLQKGKTPEQIAEELDEELSDVKRICRAAEACRPYYDCDAIYERMKGTAVKI